MSQLRRKLSAADTQVEANVDLDAAGAIAKLGALRAAAIGVTGAVSTLDSGLSAGGVRLAAFGAAAVAAGTLLTPLVGGITALGSLATSAVAGLGLVGAAAYLMAYRIERGDAAFQQLRDTWESFRGEFFNAFGPASESLGKLSVDVLKFATSLLPMLGKAANAAVGALGDGLDSVMGVLTAPAQMGSLKTLLASMVPILRNLVAMSGNFIGGLLNAFAAASGPAASLSRYLLGISQAFLRWSQSKAGVAAVVAAVRSAQPVFSALWDVTKQLIASLLSFGSTNAGAIAQAIRIIGGGISGLITLFSGLTRIVGPAGIIITALAPIFLGVLLVVGQFATAIATVAALMSGPIIVAAIALGVAAILIARNWGKIQQVFAKLAPIFNKAKAIIKNFVTVIRGLFSGNTGTEQFNKAFLQLPRVVQGAISRALVALRSLQTGVKRLWTTIRPTVTAIANVIRKALGAAFKFAMQQGKVIVNWFRANWPLIQKTVTTVMNLVRKIVGAVIKFVWNIIKTTVGGLVNFWRANWDTIRAIIVSVWNIIKTVISTAIKNALNIIKLAMQLITGDWKGAWNTIKSILSTTWNAMVTIGKESIKILGNALKLGWEAIKSGVASAWGAIKTEISSNIDMILGTINGFIEKIKSAVNTVLGLVGLPALGSGGGDSGGGSSERASGPRSGDVRGTRVPSFAEGGRVDPRPGGVYRVAEAGEPEWVLNPRSPNYEQHLRSAAAQGGYRVSRGGRGNRPHRRGGSGLFPPWRAYGADSLGPTMHTYIPEMQEFVDAAESEFGVYTNTYSNHPPGFRQPYYRERSMDMWAPGGYRGAPLSPEMHAKTVPWTIDYLGDNLNWLISEGRMLTSAGWGPDTSGYSHYDHQHTTAFADGPSATGGGSGGNLKATIFEAAWKRLVQPIIDSKLDPLTSSDFFAARAAGAAGQHLTDGIHDWILGKLGSTSGGSGGSGLSGTPAENRELGAKMFPDSGLAGSFSSIDSIWTQESGWDETADNPDSTAYGIPQFLDSTWAQYGGVSHDAEGQIRKGYAYVGDRYDGSADKALAFKQANGWYEGGGLITRQHQAIVDPGELYLPLDSRQVQRSAQVALGTAELRAENARNHRELLHRLGNVGLNNETIRQQANVARAATVGTLYSRDGLEAHSVNALRAERRDRMASV